MQARAKPVNYGKLANLEQEEMEAPGKFLDRLTKALHRFTEIDPKSEEEKVILKDRFLTQSAPDICCKLQTQAFGPNQFLKHCYSWLRRYIRVENMRKRKKGKKRQRKRRKPSPWL